MGAEAVANNIDDADDVHYQLVYKDDEDYYSDYDQYDLDHLSDEYLDYLYQIYDEMNNDITYFDDDTENVVNPEAEAVVILHVEYLDKFLNISKEEVKEETTETIEDFVVEELKHS